MKWFKRTLHIWQTEQGFFIQRWWTLCGPKTTYYFVFRNLEALEKGENIDTFSSLKEAKNYFKNL